MANDQVRHNEAEQRFELDVNGMTAVAEYQRDGNILTFTHTEVPIEFREHGIGKKLARGALEMVQAAGDKVIPQCPFIAHFMKTHPEFEDLHADQ
jgi:predicted GNAT family acetyltransferase